MAARAPQRDANPEPPKKPPKVKPATRRAAFAQVTRDDFAELVGRRWQAVKQSAELHGIPLEGSPIDLHEVLAWYHGRLLADAATIRKLEAEVRRGRAPAPATEDGADDDDHSGLSIDELDRRKRIEEVEKLQLANSKTRGQLRDVDEVVSFLGLVSGVLRQAVETLERKLGPDARELITEALDEVESLVDDTFRAAAPDPLEEGDGVDLD